MFNPSKHFEFNTDVKGLYVCITRARSKLMMYEESEEACRVLQDFLQLCRRTPAADRMQGMGNAAAGLLASGAGGGGAPGSLVSVCGLSAELLHVLRASSSNEEWRRAGEELYWERKYERAEVSTHCTANQHWWLSTSAASACHTPM